MQADTCARHQFDAATAACQLCRARYCDACVVYPRGPKKPPLCIQCALAAGGVRRSAAAPVVARSGGLFGLRKPVAEPARVAFNGRPRVELPDIPDGAPRKSDTPEEYSPAPTSNDYAPAGPASNGHGYAHANEHLPGANGHDTVEDEGPTTIPRLRVRL